MSIGATLVMQRLRSAPARGSAPLILAISPTVSDDAVLKNCGPASIVRPQNTFDRAWTAPDRSRPGRLTTVEKSDVKSCVAKPRPELQASGQCGRASGCL